MKKKNYSEKDKKDWENFLKSDVDIEVKDKEFFSQNIAKQSIPKLDLHGSTLEESNSLVKKFIINYYNRGYKKLIIITGIGTRSKTKDNPYVSENLSILKNSIPEYIKTDDSFKNIVSNVSKASIRDGGEGAIYVFLKKKL